MRRAGIIEMAAGRRGSAARRPLGARLGWFVLIWAGSVLALGLVGYAIRLVLR